MIFFRRQKQRHLRRQITEVFETDDVGVGVYIELTGFNKLLPLTIPEAVVLARDLELRSEDATMYIIKDTLAHRQLCAILNN